MAEADVLAEPRPRQATYPLPARPLSLDRLLAHHCPFWT